MSRNKARGTAAESAVVKYLNSKGFNACRVPLQGSGDLGDIHVRLGDRYNISAVIEVKSRARAHITLRELNSWWDELEQEREALLRKEWFSDGKRVGHSVDNALLVIKLVGVGKAADFLMYASRPTLDTREWSLTLKDFGESSDFIKLKRRKL